MRTGLWAGSTESHLSCLILTSLWPCTFARKPSSARKMAIRNDGDWEGWLKFFLRGVHEVSHQATDTSRAILDLRERNRQKLGDNALGVQLLEYLFEQPLVTVRMVERRLRCSFVTANKLVD
jgi:Fic family protein